MADHDADDIELAYFRIPVRITKDDVERLERAARVNDITLGYYLDIIIADKTNELRQRAGEPILPSPFLAPTDPWRNQRPSGAAS